MPCFHTIFVYITDFLMKLTFMAIYLISFVFYESIFLLETIEGGILATTFSKHRFVHIPFITYYVSKCCLWNNTYSTPFWVSILEYITSQHYKYTILLHDLIICIYYCVMCSFYQSVVETRRLETKPAAMVCQ